MSRICFVFVFLLLHRVLAHDSDQDSMPTSTQIESATQLARCRAHCIDAFSHRFEKSDSDHASITNVQCMSDRDCWMCWDYCGMFQANFEQLEALCNQKALCFEGCRLACFVYGTSSDSSSYRMEKWSFPSAPKVESDIAAGWLRLRWPDAVPLTAVVPPLPHVLYVIFWHPDSTKPWLPLEQTVSTWYETRHGDIVIGGTNAEFLVVAVTRDGLVTIGRPYKESKAPTVSADESSVPGIALDSPPTDSKEKEKTRIILAIVGASILAGVLFAVGLVFLYRMIQAQRRRHPPMRTNAIRFRPRSRHRYTSASSRAGLVTGLNVAKLEATVLDQQKEHQRPVQLPVSKSPYTAIPDRHRFAELFKGTMFESPPPCDYAEPGRRSRFSFTRRSWMQFDNIALNF